MTLHNSNRNGKFKRTILLVLFCLSQIEAGVTENQAVLIDIGIFSAQQSSPQVYNYWTEIFHQIKVIYDSVQSLHVKFRVTHYETIEQLPNDQLQRLKSEDGFDEEYTRKFLSSKQDIANMDISLMHYNSSSKFETIYYHTFKKCMNSIPTTGGVIIFAPSSKKYVLNLAWALGKIIKSLDYNQKSECQDLNEDGLLYNIRRGRQHLLSCLDQNFLNITFSPSDNCFRHFPHLSQPPPFDFEFDTGFEDGTVEQECKDLVGEEKAVRSLSAEEKILCADINCASVKFDRLDGSNCGNGGRCIDGICMDPGKLLVNVATGRCLVASDRFAANDKPILIDCPSVSSFTQRWNFMVINGSRKIKTLYINKKLPDQNELKYKCLALSINDTANIIETGFCSSWNHFKWNLAPANFTKGSYLLSNTNTNHCVSDELGNAVVKENCDESNSANLWKLYSTTGECDWTNEEDCVANLKIDAFGQLTIELDGTEQIILDVNLTNLGYPAVAAGVSVSFNNSLRLISPADNCFLYYETAEKREFRCKVGRVVVRDETVHICRMEFQVAQNKARSPSKIMFNLTAFSASKLAKPAVKLVAVEIRNKNYEDVQGPGVATAIIIIVAIIGITVIVMGVIIFMIWSWRKYYNKVPTDIESNQSNIDHVKGENNAQESNVLLTDPPDVVNSESDRHNSSSNISRFETIIVGSSKCTVGRLVRELSSSDSITVLEDNLSNLARWLDVSEKNRTRIRRRNLSKLNEFEEILKCWRMEKSDSATLQRLIEVLEEHQLNNISNHIKSRF